MKEEFFITKEDGRRIALCVFKPEGEKKSYPTVIFSHGFGGNYRVLWGHGQRIADSGIVCVYLDFCGGGMDSYSDGVMQEMSVLTEADDLCTVLDWAVRQEYVDNKNIFLLGESMGGFVSSYVAALRPEIVRSLVLWYPAFVIPDDARRRFEANDTVCLGIDMGPLFDTVAKDIDIYSHIVNYTGPVLIIHGTDDDIVPIAYAERASKTYKDAKLIVIPGAGHGFDEPNSSNVREYSIEFIKGKLKRQEE